MNESGEALTRRRIGFRAVKPVLSLGSGGSRARGLAPGQKGLFWPGAYAGRAVPRVAQVQPPRPTDNDTGARPLTPMARAAAGLKSMTRPATNGPRSLIRTTTARPL
jgi:hypothetical protein